MKTQQEMTRAMVTREVTEIIEGRQEVGDDNSGVDPRVEDAFIRAIYNPDKRLG